MSSGIAASPGGQPHHEPDTDGPRLRAPRPTARGPVDALTIGVLGGTFDPIHHGHLRMAVEAREALGLDQVRLVPLAHAVHREQPETPAWLRLAMLHAALDGREDLVADERELQRGGPSYTVDTLRSLQQQFSPASLCLLLGADAFASFPGWHDPSGILALGNIAVLQRPGHALPADPVLQALLARHQTRQLDPRRPCGQIVICPVTQLDIASSDIRRRIAEGHSADFLLPDAVRDLIAEHGLYR